MNVFPAAPGNSRFILKCCQKDILNFSYIKTIKHQRSIFPYIKPNQSSITTLVLSYTLGLALSFRQRINVGLAVDNFPVALDRAT